jgi:hypothetical protein
MCMRPMDAGSAFRPIPHPRRINRNMMKVYPFLFKKNPGTSKFSTATNNKF